jgi:NAD(P)H-hydrate epimerase
MQKILTAEEMREVDRLTTEKYGIPSIILMENAAQAATRVIIDKLGGSVVGKSVLILCGKGNNGGDGAALARILWMEGARVFVYLFGEIEKTKGDARINFEAVREIARTGKIYFEENILIDEWVHTVGFELGDYDIFVDALFGTGLSRPLDSIYRNLVSIYTNVEADKKPVLLSVDVPSGLDADSANPLGKNFRADVTVTFTAPKLANILPPASHSNGELHIANIGSPPELIDNCSSQTFVSQKEDAQKWLDQTSFSEGSYKGKRGNALLIVGSKNFSGAAVLAGNAAMISGVGLVTIATSESAQSSVSTRVMPEVMTVGMAETESGAVSERAFGEIVDLSKKADVLAIGSGLSSTEETTRNLVKKIVENRKTPIVIDADGLNSLAPLDLPGSNEFPLILTPHEGEFKRLLGESDKDLLKDRIKAVRDFSQKHKVILVLKGERTLIAEPGSKVVINPTGNSGLGKAGNGDNLTGIITGCIAQAIQAEVDIFETVVAAVYLAGTAADIAAEKFGKRTMQASDVQNCLKEAFSLNIEH